MTRSKRVRLARALLAALAAGACSGAPATPPPRSTWLASDPEEQRLQLERQLRGLDVAMLETGHRYAELYWAGRDGNWEAAAYQAGKIRLAIENGLERRPQRAASARAFLAGPLAALDEALAARDAERLATRFQQVTDGCNACHALEKVAFFEVRPPQVRASPLRREVEAEGARQGLEERP
jgi:hypothetical protein